MNKKHLAFDDRLAIQAGLQQGLKVAQIAKRIGKNRSTIGREISFTTSMLQLGFQLT